MKWETGVPDGPYDVLAELEVQTNGAPTLTYLVLTFFGAWMLEGVVLPIEDQHVQRWMRVSDIAAIGSKPDKRVPEVTAVVDLFTRLNRGHIDDASRARKGAYTLILKMRKIYPGYDDIMPLMERFLTRVKEHEFHGPAATSFAYLNRYHLRLINELENAKASTRQQRSSDKFAAGVEALARQGQ